MTLKVTTAGITSQAVESVIDQLVADQVASRITAKDFTLWGKDAEAESSIRLGWTSSPQDSQTLVDGILALRDYFTSIGVNRFVLCGMGGSSLAPEVITQTAGVDLVVLDSTNPEQVGKALNGDLKRTAVVVSSKSGSTVETDSQKRLFEEAFTNAGIDKRDRIVIVTDPGSPMEKAAIADGYRIFNADPTVGGRYSALTAFGLVPSGLAGADIARLLQEASSAVETLSKDDSTNPGLVLGAVMARTRAGSSYADKIALVEDGTPIVGLGDWAEQLIAESTGKLGKGVLPVVLGLDAPELIDKPNDLIIARLVSDAVTAQANGVSVSGSLGEQFLLWEYATVVASRLIGINPFDQPDVESAKVAARGMLESREDESSPDFIEGAIEVRTQGFDLQTSADLASALRTWLSLAESDSYVSIHAYLDRVAYPQVVGLRNVLAKVSGRPTTFGWAPRFLHSTGQYHKGGPAQGIYLQLTSRPVTDIAVPGRDFTLGELIASQASGDAKVLAEHGRPVLRLTVSDVAEALAQINASFQE
ncbi:MAG: glucose-6-phosphate isomerase [Micrococcales bacterium]